MLSAALLILYKAARPLSVNSRLAMRLLIKANVPLASDTQGATCGSACMAPNTLACINSSNTCCVGGVCGEARSITPATYKATSIFSPSSRQDKPLTLAGLATSSLKASAPRACSLAQPSSLRAVASTRQPSATYWRANSWPMPREAPKIKTVFIVGLLAELALKPIPRQPRCPRHRQCTAWPNLFSGHVL